MNKFRKNYLNEVKIDSIRGLTPEFLAGVQDYAIENYNAPSGPDNNQLRRYSVLMQSILQRQEGHYDELTEIALDLIYEYYGNLLEDVKLDAKIIPPGDPEQLKMVEKMALDEEDAKKKCKDGTCGFDEDLDTAPEPDPDEVAKRKILNNIQQGEAQNVHSMILGAKDRIDSIIPGLTDDYLEFLELNKSFDWMDAMNLAQAPELTNVNEVDWDEEEDEEEPVIGIKARGLDLPILIHEVVKGIYELISANAISEDYLSAMGVLNKTDTAEDEKEDIRYGPFIASTIRDFVNECIENVSGASDIPNIREFIFGKMVGMEAEDFLDLIEDILSEQTQADLIISFIREIKDEHSEYDYDQAMSQYEEPEDYNDSNMDSEIADLLKKPYSKKTVEEPATERSAINYNQMSQREIQYLMDQALDNKDYKKVQEISRYIKESKMILQNKFYKL